MNDYEIRVYAMQRSGHHAVINWIIGCLGGKVHFINDFSRLRDLSIHSSFYNLNKDEINQEINNNFINKKALIVNFEEESFGKINKSFFSNLSCYPRGESRTNIDIIILRDPYNLFASRYKKSFNKPKLFKKWTDKKAQNLWLEQAKEFLGETNLINNGNKKIFINYNKWFLNKKYRINTAKNIGIEFSDKNFFEVPKYGGGSSFDKREFNLSANKMNVLKRWEEYCEDNIYKKIFIPEIHLYASKIFNKELNLKKIREILK